jgi:hypothetical protein
MKKEGSHSERRVAKREEEMYYSVAKSYTTRPNPVLL